MFAQRCLLIVALCGVAVDAACSHEDVRSGNPDWMKKIAEAQPRFLDMKLSEIMFPGSHDAGTYDWPHILGYSFYETQLAGMEEQLCRGARFFDLRVSYARSYGAFYIFHGDGVSPYDNALRRYGHRWKQVKLHIMEFVQNPAYNGEIIFLRLKVEASGFYKTDTIREQWTKTINAFSNFLVGDLGNDGNAAALTVGQVVNTHSNGAKVFLVDFVGDGVREGYYTNTREKFVWSYPTSFSGKYSGSKKIGGGAIQG